MPGLLYCYLTINFEPNFKTRSIFRKIMPSLPTFYLNYMPIHHSWCVFYFVHTSHYNQNFELLLWHMLYVKLVNFVPKNNQA